MDVDIVNGILRLCYEQQTCLFEVPILSDYFLQNRLCTNSKYVLASIKNYVEIFKISRDQNRIELFMPFEICRNNFHDGLCQHNKESCRNLHVCYEHFYTNVCRRSINCPYPHILTQQQHETILGTLIHLDLDALAKAFRIYCQSKKHLLNHSSSTSILSKGQQSTPFTIRNSTVVPPTVTFASTNNKRSTVTSQINGNASWKTNNRVMSTLKTISTQLQHTNDTPEKGLQICWIPSEKDFPTHFIDVVYSNQGKSDGGPIDTYAIYQHLGVAQVFYKQSDTADRVVQHGDTIFQSFTFIPRLLQRTVDMRHVCFINVSIETKRIPLYIDIVSKPYKKKHFEYYLSDEQTILVEFNEDIDFAKIYSNVRTHPERDGLQIKCIQLYQPETLLVEYDQEYSQSDIKKLFENQRIFHIKTYSTCAFVHFYSHDDLMRSIETSCDVSIRMTPIYIDIYSQRHLNNCLQKPQSQDESILSTEDTIKNEIISTSENKNESLVETELMVPIISSPTADQQIETINEFQPLIVDEHCSSACTNETSDNDNEVLTSDDDDDDDDDLDEIPSEFGNDDMVFDESMCEQSDLELQRNVAKSLISSLSRMEEASKSMHKNDEPQPIIYGDDHVVSIKCRPFALAFRDYVQFRIEKQRNPNDFRFLSVLKKHIDNNIRRQSDEKQQDHALTAISTIDPDLFETNETKSNKKNRRKRNKKRKITHNNQNENRDKTESATESVNEDDNETMHVIHDHQQCNKNDSSAQRLPHVYLDDDLKPCIIVEGEDHHEDNGQETGEHEDWHDVIAGGKQVLVSKKKKILSKSHTIEKNSSTTSTAAETNIAPQPAITEDNSIIIRNDCRGFVHNPKLYETFRIRLRRSFSSTNIHFQLDSYKMIIDGNIKSNVQLCLNYLNSLNMHKRSILVTYADFPLTTITNIIRMQQSTAQIKLNNQANYNRIFRSTYRLIDFQLKQYFYQQQCIYCRRANKKFKITYLQFPCEKKQSIQELNDSIKQRVLQLLNTRFTYIAIALSADLMTTKRWTNFFRDLCKHKELNKTLLIKKIDTIIQVYGVNTNVQQIQTLLTRFLDANRYETDIIATEQATGIYSLFKNDFEEMKNLEIFQDSELRIIYRHRRRILLVQCFQEKFEMVKNRIEKMISQLSTVIQSIKSPILSRHYAKSNETQRIAEASNCIISIEQRIDPNRPNDYSINLKIIGRSADNTILAQRLIKEFEEQKYSRKIISNDFIKLFNDQDIEFLQNECNACNVSYKIDRTNSSIELEGLSGDSIQIEKMIHSLCLTATRRVVDDIQQSSTQWIYYDPLTNKPVEYDIVIKEQLESYYAKKLGGLISCRDCSGHVRMFNLDNMYEVVHGKHPNSQSINIKIERRGLRNPQSIPLPTHWSPMTKTWDRVLIGRRDHPVEWKANAEIQNLLRLPEMLSESWIIEIHRIQNPRVFQQYVALKEKLTVRCQANELILYRLGQSQHIDDMCANGFNQSHTDSAFSTYGHGCHFYCKIKDINRAATLLAQNHQTMPIRLQQQTPSKPSARFLFVCKVLVGRYTRGDSSMKTCPPGYDSLVDNMVSPEVFVPSNDAQVLPEYLITYQSDIF